MRDISLALRSLPGEGGAPAILRLSETFQSRSALCFLRAVLRSIIVPALEMCYMHVPLRVVNRATDP